MSNPVSSIVGVPTASRKDANMGLMLVEQGKMTSDEVESVRRLQKAEGLRFGEAAQRLGLVTEADIQQVLAHQFDYPYLQAGGGNYSPELMAAYQPFSAEVEMLRSVRSELMLRWFRPGRKSLAIASANPGDGASLLAANLAVVISQLGEQTLLVDANLRNPSQHKIFNLDAGRGLADVLAGRAGLDMLEMAESFVDLSLLPAGSPVPNPQELISRASFVATNKTLCERFDIILYDTPAFSSAADALTIAARAGGVLLVVRKDHTRMADLSAFSDQLRRSGTEVVGSVMVSF
ncbi:chain length determinant protein tyrosine kinase EpsG [Collimonas arenae]|uniref:Chain length determinant protein tyrosine kinase EpsG n=1 Tax=Collimonas arenae TaxID=279058 RepID=A0A127QKV5_9BURK|nr:chain length determinant protein tyrosine kinase EpsG [Collimonas arenae]AMP00800.1 chain length determinant protein tyrosine kinase EpsG [Collimonas arenae]AMP10693.1 chain length determinant protein tyrosine kinase EpsG [Collimonas arenae]